MSVVDRPAFMCQCRVKHLWGSLCALQHYELLLVYFLCYLSIYISHKWSSFTHVFLCHRVCVFGYHSGELCSNWCIYNVGTHRQQGHMHSDVIHVVTTSPVCLYSMDTRRQHMSCIDLCDVFPGSTTRTRPQLRLAPLSFPLDSNVVIHNELVCRAYCLCCWLENSDTCALCEQ